MHELSIATELLRQLEALAVEHNVERIESVTVRAGVMRQVVPEALEMAFCVVTQGTCAEGATLTLERVPLAAQCRECGFRFAPEMGAFCCPRCRRADVDILEGDDIILVSVTCQQEEGTASHEDQRCPECPGSK